ncbi:MAG TPA: HDOD domain-containing protein [Kofleriaceae bacterium]|nr:HDOD domain-containing protein [Kofleriaceae bacterium]
MRLLLVDDEPRILSGLSRALRTSGSREWDVATATSGDEALARLTEAPADVVMSDVNMPGMDGPTLLGEVRKRWPEVVRLVLSGYADLMASQKLAAVAHQFFDKPLRIADLVDSLRRIERLRARFAEPSLRALIGGIGELPAAPSVFVELSAIVEDPTATLDDITRVVRKDPAVSAQVLHLASSAFYARGGPIADLRGAIGRIGGRIVRMVALSAAAFRPPPKVAAMVDRIQAHSLAAGLLAEQIVGDPDHREAAFVSGLLSDLGMMALVTWMPDRYLPLLSAWSSEPIHVREKAELGVTHADVGAYLLGLWGLPRNVVEAVSSHHDPTAIGEPACDPTMAAYVAHALLADEPVDELYLARCGVTDRLARWRSLVSDVSRTAP